MSRPLVEALRHAHGRGARIVSICSGAFALAAAGLLDHRLATTHWRYAGAMLETGDAPVDEIATAAGFATAVTLRHHFAKSLHTSPSAYRRAFREQRRR